MNIGCLCGASLKVQAINNFNFVSDEHIVTHCKTERAFESFRVAIHGVTKSEWSDKESTEHTIKTLSMISRTCKKVSTYPSAPGGRTKFNFSTFQEGVETYRRANKIHQLIEDKINSLRTEKV